MQQRPASLPVDRGWAWVVALASSGIFGLAGGSLKSSGIIYVEATEHYERAGVGALWIFTVAQVATFCTGPFAGLCIRRTSHRTVVIAGATLMSTAIVASAFLTSIDIMYLTWLMQGVGAGCLYIGGLTCTSAYFDRHKGLAMGFAGAGSGVGAFLLPNALRLLFDHYTYGGALLIYGALLTHAALLAMLVRPVSYYAASAAAPSQAKKKPPAGGPRKDDAVDVRDVAAELGPKPAVGERSARAVVRIDAASASQQPPPEGALKHMLRLCRQPGLWIVCTTSFFAVCGISVVYPSMPPLGRQTGVDKATVAMLIAVGGAAETLSRPLHGWLSDRRYVSSVGHASVCAGLASLGNVACALLGGGTVGLGVLSALLGLFGTAIMSLLPVVIRDLLGADSVELSMGVQMAFQAAGVLVATAATDAIVTQMGSWLPVFYFIGGCFAMASVTAGSFAVKLRVGSRVSRDQNSIS